MSINKKFSFYAVESFDDSQVQNGVVIYDKCEDVPVIEPGNPDVTVEIKFTGDLDNPYERELFNYFLSVLGVKDVYSDADLSENVHGVLCQKPMDYKLEFSEDEAVLEALGTAMEDNVFTKIGDAAKAVANKIGNIKTGSDIKKNAKTFSEVSGVFKQNEAQLTKAISSNEKQQSLIEPVIATRYFLDNYSEDNPLKLYVCFEEGTKTLRQRNFADIIKGLDTASLDNLVNLRTAADTSADAKKAYTSLYTQLAQKIMQNIKNATSGKDVYGYTESDELADKFKNSASSTQDGSSTSDTSKKNSVSEYRKLDEEKQYDKLAELWKSKSGNERSAMLDELFGDAKDKIPKDVKVLLLSLTQPPFGKLSWDMIKYHLNSSSTKPFDKAVFELVITKQNISDLLKQVGLKGLDFSNQTQFAVIDETLKKGNKKEAIKIRDALHQGSQNVWLSVDEMKPYYTKLKNIKDSVSTTDTTDITSQLDKKDAKDITKLFVDLAKEGKIKLTEDQMRDISGLFFSGKRK